MEKIQLRYYGKHQPPGIYEVRKEVADILVKNDDYDFVDNPIKTPDILNIPTEESQTKKSVKKKMNDNCNSNKK